MVPQPARRVCLRHTLMRPSGGRAPRSREGGQGGECFGRRFPAAPPIGRVGGPVLARVPVRMAAAGHRPDRRAGRRRRRWRTRSRHRILGARAHGPDRGARASSWRQCSPGSRGPHRPPQEGGSGAPRPRGGPGAQDRSASGPVSRISTPNSIGSRIGLRSRFRRLPRLCPRRKRPPARRRSPRTKRPPRLRSPGVRRTSRESPQEPPGGPG